MRWRGQRDATGWRVGLRNDEAKVHPDLVSWDELAEDRRQIDLDHVLELPEVVASIRRRIVRYRDDDE